MVPIEWEIVYPVHVYPIGHVRARAGRFEAKLADEHLGRFLTGDAAAEAVCARFLDQSVVRHELPSRTHGGEGRRAAR